MSASFLRAAAAVLVFSSFNVPPDFYLSEAGLWLRDKRGVQALGAALGLIASQCTLAALLHAGMHAYKPAS